MTSKQKSIVNILQQSKNELADLIHKVNHLKELNQHLSHILDDKLAKHCQIANFDHDILVIAADDSNWATHIRYMTPDLLKQLKKIPDFRQIKNIRCIITPKE